MSNSMSSQTQLLSILSDIQVRDEVQSVLDEVLYSVETAYYVNLTHRYETQVSKLKQQVTVLGDEVAERRAMSEVEKEKRVEMADKLVAELWALSVKLERMEKWEKNNCFKVEKFNEVQQELKRQEEKVRSLQRHASLSQNANLDLGDSEVDLEKPATAASLNAAMTALIEEEQSNSVTKTNVLNAEFKAEGKEVKEAVTEVESDQNDNNTPSAKTKPLDNGSESKKVVVEGGGKEKTGDEKQLTLKSLKEKNLLDVFSFLEAIDVLHCAQVDKEFYSRVDLLFGIGSKVVNKSAVTTTNENGSNAVETKVSKANPKDVAPKKIEEPSSTSSSPSKLAAGRFLANFVSPSSNDASNDQQQRPLLAYVSSIVQKQAQKSTSASPSFQTTFSDTLSPGSSGQSQTRARNESVEGPPPASGLTASMADSMANKLTPSELGVIIAMTEKLRQREKDIKRIAAEREDFAARLEGSEAVKDYLIGKVQKSEAALKKCTEEAVLANQQSASDQEVIAFLDGRVQGLEKIRKDISSKKKKLEALLLQTKERSEKRTKILEDMLQFERQQLAEQEKDSKATKKILVKEVKHCHAQIAALKAERDSFQQQNQQLKQALLKRNGTTKFR